MYLYNCSIIYEFKNNNTFLKVNINENNVECNNDIIKKYVENKIDKNIKCVEFYVSLYDFEIIEKTYESGYFMKWHFDNAKLIKHIDNVDLVIFVATANGRLYYPDDDLQFISSMWTVDAVLTGQINNPIFDISKPIFKAAKEYYLHLSDNEFDMYIHGQIIKSIQELCSSKNKKLILIPAFGDTVKYQTIFSFPLIEIMYKELEATFNDRQYRLETSLKTNHISRENNKRLAKIVDDILKNNLSSANIDMFEFKKESNPELHWKL
jgi:hypothetical protein